ncbi:MAG: tail fiber domain-containing protein, partial [Burkholderiaceae bacterium]
AQTGAKVLSEGVRARGDLATRVRSAEAQAKLNAPLAAQQLYGAIGESQSALAGAASKFTTDLRESAALGRLQLAGSYGGFVNNAGQFGLNLATGVPFNATQAVSGMRADRFGQATQTTNKRAGFMDYAGPLIGAGASIGGALLGSSAEFKELLAQYGEADADTFLDAVVGMPVHRWRYKGGIGFDAETMHVGPIAEDWQKATGYGSSRTISVLDVLGVLMLSIKALHARVAELEMDAA